MTDRLRAAAQAALETLDSGISGGRPLGMAATEAASELRAALSEPEEPVDDVWFEDRNGAGRKSPKDCQRFGANGVPEAVWVNGNRYTLRKWVPLTDEEIEAAWKSCDPQRLLPSFAAAIEAALREKNHV